MFVGRSKELQDLNNYYENDRNGILILYGQPGIGKKTLLKHFLEGKEYYYYKAVSCSFLQQRDYLSKYLTGIGFSFSGLPDYKEILSSMGNGSIDKRIVVIDEFHNICKNTPEFLQEIEAQLKEEENSLFFILVSSQVSWVEELRELQKAVPEALEKRFYKMKELKYQDLITYFDGFTKEESLRAYSILGGIPGLWKYFNKNCSLKENMVEVVLKEGQPLFSLGQQLVAEELRETAVYNTILSCLAEGNEKLNELFHVTGFSRAKISVYLKNLMQPGLVEKAASMETKGREFTKKGIYRINHSYVQFYYRYLFGKESIIRQMGREAFFEKMMSDFPSFIGESFRLVCLEFIEKENDLGRLPGNFTYQGQWIGKKGNIDFIFEDIEEGEILAGMCSPKGEAMTMEEYQCFLECEKQSGINADLIILFSCYGFDNYLRDTAKKNPRLALVSLEQMSF